MDGELDYLDPAPCYEALPRGAWLLGSVLSVPGALLALALLQSLMEN